MTRSPCLPCLLYTSRKVIFDERDYLEEIFQEHKAVLEAVKNRDVEGAKAAMAKHLDGSKRRAEFIYNVK